MNKDVELHLLAVRLLSTIDDVDMPLNGFKKSIRTIEEFARKRGEHFDAFNENAHALAVHNFNVIMDNISHEVLMTPIGNLEIIENE